MSGTAAPSVAIQRQSASTATRRRRQASRTVPKGGVAEEPRVGRLAVRRVDVTGAAGS
jgi:hypothetical protein